MTAVDKSFPRAFAVRFREWNAGIQPVSNALRGIGPKS